MCVEITSDLHYSVSDMSMCLSMFMLVLKWTNLTLCSAFSQNGFDFTLAFCALHLFVYASLFTRALFWTIGPSEMIWNHWNHTLCGVGPRPYASVLLVCWCLAGWRSSGSFLILYIHVCHVSFIVQQSTEGCNWLYECVAHSLLSLFIYSSGVLQVLNIIS